MRARHGSKEAGMALVVAMMVMALLSVLALAGIATSTLEVKIAGNDRESKQAFFLCESGLQYARYNVVQGWGTGTPGGTAPNWTFAFDPLTMPATVQSGGSIGWAPNQWVNFTLVDDNGLLYRIQAHDTSYNITDCVGPTIEPKTGFGRILYNNDGIAVAYAGGTPTAGAVTFSPSPGWTVDWTGYVLRDTADNYFPITGNTVDTLTVSGGAPSGSTFFILRAVGAPGQFTLFENRLDPANEPGAPNAEWATNTWTLDDRWFLIDRTDTVFAITGTSYQPDRMVLAVTGTPATGAFQLVTNPWLEWLETAGPQNMTFSGPSTGLAYGSVLLSTTPIPGLSGKYKVTAVSTSTTTGTTKQIFFDVALRRDSLPRLSDWRSQVQ